MYIYTHIHVCVCIYIIYTGETWTQVKSKAETDCSDIPSTITPIRLSNLEHNYIHIFCSIRGINDNFLSKPFLFFLQWQLINSKVSTHWTWPEEKVHFLTWMSLTDNMTCLLVAAIYSTIHAPSPRWRQLDTVHNTHGKFFMERA